MTESAVTPSPQPQTLRVVVTDVDMPMASIVRFMVKWVIASIPAIIILTIIGLLIGIALSALAGIAALLTSATHL